MLSSSTFEFFFEQPKIESILKRRGCESCDKVLRCEQTNILRNFSIFTNDYFLEPKSFIIINVTKKVFC